MLAISFSLFQLVLLPSLPSLTILGFDDNCTVAFSMAASLHQMLRGLYSRLIYMLLEGLATKQHLFILIANATLRHKHKFLYSLSHFIQSLQHITRTGSGVSWNREVGVPNNPLPRLTQKLRYKGFIYFE